LQGLQDLSLQIEGARTKMIPERRTPEQLRDAVEHGSNGNLFGYIHHTSLQKDGYNLFCKFNEYLRSVVLDKAHNMRQNTSPGYVYIIGKKYTGRFIWTELISSENQPEAVQTYFGDQGAWYYTPDQLFAANTIEVMKYRLWIS
jgi:hypothetical protein